jgi:hypothetical protein
MMMTSIQKALAIENDVLAVHYDKPVPNKYFPALGNHALDNLGNLYTMMVGSN